MSRGVTRPEKDVPRRVSCIFRWQDCKQMHHGHGSEYGRRLTGKISPLNMLSTPCLEINDKSVVIFKSQYAMSNTQS